MVPLGDNHIFFNENSTINQIEENFSDEKNDWWSTLNSLFIRSDRCTFNTDVVSLNCMSSFNGYLIIRFVSIFQTQIVIFAIDIDVRKDQLKEKVTVVYLFFSQVTLISMNKTQTISLIHAQMIRVISSPSNSTTGFATLIRFCGGVVEPENKENNIVSFVFQRELSMFFSPWRTLETDGTTLLDCNKRAAELFWAVRLRATDRSKNEAMRIKKWCWDFLKKKRKRKTTMLTTQVKKFLRWLRQKRNETKGNEQRSTFHCQRSKMNKSTWRKKERKKRREEKRKIYVKIGGSALYLFCLIDRAEAD